MVTKCRGKDIDSVFDIIEMENDDRDNLLKLGDKEMANVARFCNRYYGAFANLMVSNF